MTVFDWSGYLDVADHLVTMVGGEAAERSALSRAYYACYGTAWAYARSKQVPLTGSGRDHQLVWAWFLEGSGHGPVHVRVGTTGRRLKTWRIRADYNRSNVVGVSGLANGGLALARRLVTDLATLP